MPFVFLNEILNAEDVNFRKIAKIIEFDSGVNLTLRLYYKALFIETQKPISQKKWIAIRSLLIRNITKTTKFKGFSKKIIYNKNTIKSKEIIEIVPNKLLLRKLAIEISCNQESTSNLLFSLNHEYTLNSQIYSWNLNQLNGNSIYIHVRALSVIGSLVNKLSQNNLSYSKIIKHFMENGYTSETAESIVHGLIENKIIFSEMHLSKIKLNELYDLSKKYSTKNDIVEKLSTILEKILEIQDDKNVEKIVNCVRDLEQIVPNVDPISVNSLQFEAYDKEIHYPKNILKLFERMGVLRESYAFGRSVNLMLREKYGLFTMIPIKEALGCNRGVSFERKVEQYTKNDVVYQKVLQEWTNYWLMTLTRSNSDIVNLSEVDLQFLIEKLEQAMDHKPIPNKYNILSQKIHELGIEFRKLPVNAIFPSDENISGRVSIDYFPENFPEIDNSEKTGDSLKINQYTDNNEININDIFVMCTFDDIRIIDTNGKSIKLYWNNILDPSHKGESKFVSRLKLFIDYINQVPFNSIPWGFDKLYHVPSVRYKNILLSKEYWNLSLSEVNNLAEDLSGYNVLENGSEFPLKLITEASNTSSKKYTVCKSDKFESEYLTESFTNLIFFDEFKEAESCRKLININHNNEVQSNYKSFSIVLPSDDFQFYIFEILKIVPNIINSKKFFFIRYFEEGQCIIRLRLRSTIPGLETSYQELKNELALLGCSVTLTDYFPEENRYGKGKLASFNHIEFEYETIYFLDIQKQLKGANLTENFFEIEYAFLQIFLEIWGVKTMKDMYGQFKFKQKKPKIKKNLTTLKLPDLISKNLIKIANLSKQFFISGDINPTYMYFSIIHMAQNRIVGIDQEAELSSKLLVKQFLIRGIENERA